MDIQGFATITQRIIARDGFDNYLPTLCLPERKNISVFEGIPADKRHKIRDISMQWAEDKAKPDEEYFLAYKEDVEHFRVIHKCENKSTEDTFCVNKEQK